MINRRNSHEGLLFAAVLVALLLTGCRAFQPEAVIVNKPPETYLIGAPVEEGGGYYHFHVFWYGSDEDGRVERFVWALTDTSLQDPDTTDDEEDQNFNPALDASTLEIANWTTRTDSIFNFTIDQGTNQSADMTLHMVAVDDFGDYDRTPARLYFFSNTLGNPLIRFFRIDGGDTIALADGQIDTVGFGFPYQVHWSGETPNIRGYSDSTLALVDTVPPFDDGLFGYKWQLGGELGGNCLPSLEDCWHPRRFNEATGDSFSFFGPVRSLLFENNGSGSNPFRKLLPSGLVSLQVNSLDIAGVEVADFRRSFGFMVNFDPETIVLDGETDWAHPEDPQEYPYYILLNDPDPANPTRYPFQSGARIPDRSYVVVKALARDDPRDGKLDESFKVGLTGFIQGVRSNYFGGTFSFASESSELDIDPTWDATCDTCWYADTLGFLTGPATRFTFNMQSVDEHGRRDGSPANLSFDVGFPPCLQCVEFLPKSSLTSAYAPSLECVGDDPSTHPCFQDTPEMRVTSSGAEDYALEFIQPIFMLVDKGTYFVDVSDTDDDQNGAKYVVPSRLYRMTILLHSKDDAREAWSEAVRRSGAFAYQIDYECDPFNQIKDGGGSDDIREPTWGAAGDGVGLRIDPASGLWRLEVDVVVPEVLVGSGPETYLTLLTFVQAGGDPDIAQAIFDSTVKQFGNGTIRVVAIDQTQCNTTPVRPGSYNYFKKVRPSGPRPASNSWRDCSLIMPDIKGSLPLSRGAMASRPLTDPLVMDFRLVIETPTGDYTCEIP